jgi:PBP1b-binding outer membrane lipoprotein LpoB
MNQTTMKTFASILLGSLLLFGCSRQDSSKQGVKYQTEKLESWPYKDFTNYALQISFADKAKNIQTNVDSLDQAANILGQYGWELVSSETANDHETYHMKRQMRDDGCGFYFGPNLDSSLMPDGSPIK